MLKQEFGPPLELTEVQVVERRRGKFPYDPYDAITLLDGEAFYLQEDYYLIDPEPGCSATVLAKTISSFLGTEREIYTYETRTAPETRAGICAWPKGSLCRHDEPLFAVVPLDVLRVRSERERRTELSRQQARIVEDLRAREIEFEEAKATHERTGAAADKETRAIAFQALLAVARSASRFGIFDGPTPLLPRPCWLSKRD